MEPENLTDEKHEKARQLIEAYLACYERGICPHCQTPIESEEQRGRCIYVQPCGHRIGQGFARKRTEPAHQD
jgi:hypothetical protein